MDKDLKQEILKYLVKRDNMHWEALEHHLLYLRKEHAESYLKAMENESYSRGFHNDTVEIIKNNVEEIFGNLDEVNLIDLGPGYPDKSLPIAEFLVNKAILNYFLVDISPLYLKIAKGAMQPYCASVNSINLKFEDLPDADNFSNLKNKYVMLGLTFMNFNGGIILKLLKKIINNDGHVIIASELKNKSEKEIIQQYLVEEARELTFGPLDILGFNDKDFTYDVQFKNSRVEVSFIAKTDVESEAISFVKGTRITTAISYRYSQSELEDLLVQYFKSYKLYFSNSGTTVLAVCDC